MPSQSEIQHEITTRIIDGLKNGVVPWKRCWRNDPNCGSPANAITRRPYERFSLLEYAGLVGGAVLRRNLFCRAQESAVLGAMISMLFIAGVYGYGLAGAADTVRIARRWRAIRQRWRVSTSRMGVRPLTIWTLAHGAHCRGRSLSVSSTAYDPRRPGNRCVSNSTLGCCTCSGT